MSADTSLPPDYFERMFAENGDPWQFETSPYEAAKYDVTLAALSGRKYEKAFEVGCANGVLTKRLAPSCRSLRAIDVSASALALAQARCDGMSNVIFLQMNFPEQRPDGAFDLIVMSEVVYYWSASDIAIAGDYVRAQLRPGGDLMMVHWIGETDYPQSGDDAVRLMRDALPSFDIMRSDRHDKFRLDLWRRP